jgi:hypothetical protein
MKFFLFLSLIFLSLSKTELAHAQERAVVVRETELKKQPYVDAMNLATMKAEEKIDLISRKASWMEVRYGSQQGWVKMLSLRFVANPLDAKEGKSSTSNTLKSLYNLGTTGKSGSTVTTAARGLDENKFANPSPNAAALEQAQTFASNKTNAEKFASEIKLKEQQQAYLKAKGEK